MSRPNHGDPQPPNPLSPYQAGGQPMAAPPAGPYGPGSGYAGPTPPSARSNPTPAGLFNALKRRWVMATFVGGLVAATAAVAVWMLMPAGKHTARALVEIRSSGPNFGTRGGDDADAFRKSQMFLMTTRDLLSRTVNEPAIASLDMIKNADDPVNCSKSGSR